MFHGSSALPGTAGLYLHYVLVLVLYGSSRAGREPAVDRLVRFACLAGCCWTGWLARMPVTVAVLPNQRLGSPYGTVLVVL
jgi:hypothetical protein